jgi:hypothetical protein
MDFLKSGLCIDLVRPAHMKVLQPKNKEDELSQTWAAMSTQ